jgi:uncharacterized membrane-anchored protein
VASGDVTAGPLRRGEPISPARQPLAVARRAASQVPERITVFFWIVKILTTAQGEATSDYLDHRIDPPIAAAVAGLAFVAALALQFRTRKYVAWIYWLAADMVAIFGTMCADGLHVELGIPYQVSTTFYAVVLAVILVLWYRTEKTLSIHSINTRRREAFYWATILATFALGTALGDLTASTLHLGYLTSGIMFTLLFAIPGLAHWRLGLNSVAAFWTASILTRPLGASYADWMGVPHNLSGLDLGRGPVAVGLTIPIILLVGYLAVSRIDVAGRAPEAGPDHGPAAAGPGHRPGEARPDHGPAAAGPGHRPGRHRSS